MFVIMQILMNLIITTILNYCQNYVICIYVNMIDTNRKQKTPKPSTFTISIGHLIETFISKSHNAKNINLKNIADDDNVPSKSIQCFGNEWFVHIIWDFVDNVFETVRIYTLCHELSKIYRYFLQFMFNSYTFNTY